MKIASSMEIPTGTAEGKKDQQNVVQAAKRRYMNLHDLLGMLRSCISQ